ncbi:hypothetical protein BMT54_11840 [Pasteurellaceae bacterium 15-036681]|nr:hypothetical protein BMT54_11840 [Pasteurellaceae bacterium 15-036681]
MNKYYHKVIFSKTQQRFVVVSELAKSEGKSSADCRKHSAEDFFGLVFSNLFTHQQSQARSTLGSLSGNITVSAGNHAHLSGVDAIASKELNREILIEGKSTYVGASQDELSSKERHEQKQSGLTIAFSSAVTDGAMAVSQALNRSEKVQDGRLGALLKVKAANEAYETVNKAKTLIDTLQNASNATEAMGNSDFKVSVSVGASKAVSTSHTQQTTHQGSELDAHHVTIRATEGDNTIVGSKINATKTELEGNNINLLATTDTQSNHSDNKNSSWSVGVFVGKSQGSTGFGVEGSVNVGKGYSNSDSQVQNNTEINSETLIIKAKDTTTLKGAVANIDHLELDTKNLHIESLQDSEKYDSKQTQAGVSASVAWGSGGGASAQASQNKAKVDYAQVNQQSGFNINKTSNINVAENTHLKGGMINAQGEKENHSMKTGTLTTENIENRSDIKISSVSAGASTDMSKMATSAMGAALSALGNMSESERSTTQSAISSNINLQITDSNAQQAKTGKTAEETLQSLNRNTESANQVVEKQDLTKIQERQEATQIVAEIGAKRVGDLAQQMGWKDGSPEKVALHGLVGYLAAKVGGGNAAASAISAMNSEYINTEIANYLAENTNLTPDQRNAIQQASAAGLGALIGASLGGDSTTTKQAAQMALRTEQFNRQLHPTEKQRIKDLAKELAQEKGGSAEYWEQQLTLVASAMNDEKENHIVENGLNMIFNSTQPMPAISQERLENEKANLAIAYQTIQNEAKKSQPLKWQDGSDVVLFGEKINMFQSTEAQYKNSQIFGSMNYPTTTQHPNTNVATLDDLGRLNGLTTETMKHRNELFNTIGSNHKDRQDNASILNKTYFDYFVAPTGKAEPVAPELYVIGGVAYTANKALLGAVATGGKYATQASSTVGAFVSKYPKATEGIVVGSISTGFDLYNDDASPEKTAMNFILGRGLAGKPLDKQLSVNAIYKGITSVSENKSDKEVALGQVSNVVAISTGGVAETLLNLADQKGISKQIIPNLLSGYLENKIDNLNPDNKKEVKKEKEKQ